MSRAWAMIGIGVLASGLVRVTHPDLDVPANLPFLVLYVVALAGPYWHLLDRLDRLERRR